MAPQPSRAIGSRTLIPEVLGPIILPSRPFVVVVCELAQESCGPVPAVGGTFGPCSELRGEVTILDATDGRGGPDHATAVELRGAQASLDVLGPEILDEIPDGLRGPQSIAVRRDVREDPADRDIAGDGPSGFVEAPTCLGDPRTQRVYVNGPVRAYAGSGVPRADHREPDLGDHFAFRRNLLVAGLVLAPVHVGEDLREERRVGPEGLVEGTGWSDVLEEVGEEELQPCSGVKV